MFKNWIAVCVICLMMVAGSAFADSTAVVEGVTAGVGIGDINSGNVNKSDADKIGKSFVIPGSVGYGPVINYFGKGGPTAGFQDIRTLLMYGSLFTEGALEEMSSSGGSCRVEVRTMNDTKVVAKKDEKGNKWIKIIVSEKPIENAVPFLHITAESDSRKGDMIAILGKAALEALKKGANVLHITAFGAARDTETSGWGIGFNGTAAKMFQQNDDGSMVGTSGMGYSSAWAGMRDKPWLQGFGLIDVSLVLPTSKVDVSLVLPTSKVIGGSMKKDAPQTGNHVPK